MNESKTRLLVFICALLLFALSGSSVSAQNPSPPIKFRSGQPVYIVGFRDSRPVVVDLPNGAGTVQPTQEHFLDLEKNADEQMRKWGYFKVVDRPSDAELVLLLYTDMSSIEGMLVSPDDFRTFYKEKFDLDRLRDVALARATAGPLKIATLGRLTDRMIKELRVKVTGP